MGVSAAYGLMAAADPDLSASQVDISTAALKRDQPMLFSRDTVFGSNLWRLHTPAFQGLMEMVLVPTQYANLTVPFRVMTPLVVMLHLGAMYALCYRQCRSSSASLYVAVLSGTVIYTLGDSHWGVGSLASVTPEAIALSLSPLIVLAYLRYFDDRWRLAVVFAVVGLMGMLHTVTAANLAIVLLPAYLAVKRFSGRAVLTACLCGLAAFVAALPYLGYFLALRAQALGSAPLPGAQVVYQAFSMAHESVLYPDLLKSLLDWELLTRVLVLAAAAGGVLAGFERFRTRSRWVWVWLAISAVVVSLGLQGASQAIGAWTGQGPPIIDFLKAWSIFMLPLYVLLAQGLTNIFRLVRTHPNTVRWACAALMVAWMLPSDNLRVLRHQAYRLAKPFGEDRVRQLDEAAARRAELAALGLWARGHTDIDCLWVTDYAQFRMLSRRSVLAVQSDVQYIYYLAPNRLREWMDRFGRQQRLLRPASGKADGADLKAFVAALANEKQGATAPQWYVLLDARMVPANTGPLRPVGPSTSYYRAFRVDLSGDTRPAATTRLD